MAIRLKASRKYPNIPQINDDPRSHSLALQPIIEILEINNRRTKDLFSSFVTVGELVDLGLIDVNGQTGFLIGVDLGEIADIGDIAGASINDFLRFNGTEWVNDTLHTADITQAMVTQHQAALSIDWEQIVNGPPLYLQQTVADQSWLDDDFLRGDNILGVRYAGAIVRIPHDLAIEKIIHIKDEAGGGFTVFAY